MLQLNVSFIVSG